MGTPITLSVYGRDLPVQAERSSSLTRLMLILIQHWTYLLNLAAAGPGIGVLNNPMVFSYL